MKSLKLLLVLGLFWSGGAAAQSTGRVVGTVTNEQGQPVASASVVVQGTRIGVVTGTNGAYVIPGVPVGAHTMVATLIGYGEATQAVTVTAGQSVVANFHLTVRAVQLEGVVAVGYGTQQKRTVTGSVATVKASQIAEVPTSNIVKAIQGRVPGVDITNTGNKPGDGVSIRIRGVRSIQASNDPLYVVDGVPIAGGIGDFNPSDIVSIDILKDAAATAVYGSRGANGVVLVTTKGAGVGGVTTQFTANASWAGQSIYALPTYMNNQQYVDMLEAAAAIQGLAPGSGIKTLTNDAQAAYAAGLHTDWQNLIKRTGQQRNFQLGMNGITGNTRFNISGNYFDQTGTAVGLKFNRATGSASVDHTQGRLRLGVTANYAHSLQTINGGDGLWGAARTETGFGLAYDTAGALIPHPDGEPLIWNPLYGAGGLIVNQNTRDRVFASAFGTFKLAEGVDLRVNFGPDYAQVRQGNFQGLVNGAASRSASTGGNTSFQYILDNMLQVNRDIGTMHHVDATLLYGLQQFRRDSTSASAQNIPYDEALYYSLNQGDNYTAYSSTSRTALRSLMGRVVYTLLDKYTISGSVRRDGASQLAPGHKWTTFPTVGAAWQIGDESFMKGFDFISTLKLRGSYGKTGNASINAYQTQGALASGKINFGTLTYPAYSPNANNPANPDLGWEKTAQTDVAVEYGLFANRITGSADWYLQNTTDLLLNRTLPGTTGYNQVLQNVGATQNKGIELQLSTINLQNWHGLRWQTDINWSHNANKVTSLNFYSDPSVCPKAAPICDVNNGWFVGYPINNGNSTNVFNSSGGFNGDQQRRQWYDYKMIGIWQLGDSAAAKPFGAKPGDIRIQDTNGNGQIDANDRVLQGSSYPKWTGSIYNRFTYKSFDLSGLVTVRWGATIFNTFNPSLFGRYGQIVTNYWTLTNPVNDQPAPHLNGNTIQYVDSKGYISGNNWRVRNIQLGYTMPQEIAGRVGASALRVYATATDPYIHFKYKFIDPELYNTGSPTYRMLQVGADVTF